MLLRGRGGLEEFVTVKTKKFHFLKFYDKEQGQESRIFA